MVGRRWITGIAIGCWLVGGAHALAAQQVDWRAELDRTVEELVERHPDPFTRVDASDFRERVEALRGVLPSLAPHEAVTRLMQLVALVGDGHTRYDSENGSHGFERRLPIVLYRFADGYHVVAATREHAGLVGARLTRIGGLSVDSAATLVQTAVSADNPSGLDRGTSYALQRMGLLRGLGIADGDEGVSVRVAGAGGGDSIAFVRAIPREDEAFAYEAMTFLDPRPDPPSGYRAPLHLHWLKHPRPAPFGWDVVPELNALHVRLHRIRDGDRTSFAAFVDSMYETLDREGLERLILDVRHNPGGNNMLLRPLIHGVIARPRLMRRGGTFVLTGRDTFSAAVNLVNRLDRETNAVFVGEAPAGAPNHFGDAEVLYHYPIDLTMIVSTVFWQDSEPWDERRAVEPDLVAVPTFADFVAGRDPAFEAIRAFIAAAGQDGLPSQ